MKRLLLAIGVASLTVTLHAQSATPGSWESVAWGRLPAGLEPLVRRP